MKQKTSSRNRVLGLACVAPLVAVGLLSWRLSLPEKKAPDVQRKLAHRLAAPCASTVDPSRIPLEDPLAVVNRFLEVPPGNVTDMLHRWRVLAAMSPWASNAHLQEEMSVILHADAFSERFPTSPPLIVKDRNGWIVRPKLEESEDNHWQYEAHVDQALALCAEAAVPLAQPIDVAAGMRISVRTLLEESRRRFVRDQESVWSLTAYMTYCPAESNWINRFGEELDYSRLLDDLLSEPLGDGPCAGAHKPYVVAFALQANDRSRFLSSSQVDRMKEFLLISSEHLSQAQLPSGAWHVDWASTAPPEAGRLQRILSVDELVFATGHHVEWMCIAPPDVRDEAIFARAAQFLAMAIAQRTVDEVQSSYCGFSHGARALALIASAGRAP